MRAPTSTRSRAFLLGWCVVGSELGVALERVAASMAADPEVRSVIERLVYLMVSGSVIAVITGIRAGPKYLRHPLWGLYVAPAIALLLGPLLVTGVAVIESALGIDRVWLTNTTSGIGLLYGLVIYLSLPAGAALDRAIRRIARS